MDEYLYKIAQERIGINMNDRCIYYSCLTRCIQVTKNNINLINITVNDFVREELMALLPYFQRMLNIFEMEIQQLRDELDNIETESLQQFNPKCLSEEKLNLVKKSKYKHTNCNDEECVFCYEKIKNDDEVIKCPSCKKIYHYQNKNCGGIVKWLSESGNSCPYCKYNYEDFKLDEIYIYKSNENNWNYRIITQKLGRFISFYEIFNRPRLEKLKLKKLLGISKKKYYNNK